MANLQDICRSYKAAGLYTHVYAACGFLNADRNTDEFALGPDLRDVFDLASLTKALVTTPAILWRCHQSGLNPRDVSIAELFGSIVVQKVGALHHNLTAASYLRHETGLPAWRNLYVECEHKRQLVQDVLKRSHSRAHSKDLYSDVGFITLGELIKESSGRSLLAEWKDRCEHFGMTSARNLGHGLEFDQTKVISTGYCPVRRRELVGEVHDENCWALGGFAGHAGLFGSGAAVTAYLRELWQTPHGRAVIEENFNERSSPGDSLMGWRKGLDQSSAGFADGRGCGHLGFTGTAFWVDWRTRSYAVLLTNRVISGRISPIIKQFRADAFTALWAKIKENQ